MAHDFEQGLNPTNLPEDSKLFDSPDARKSGKDLSNKLFTKSTILEKELSENGKASKVELADIGQKRKALADFVNDPKNLGTDGALKKDAMKDLQKLYEDLEKSYRELHGKIYGAFSDGAKMQVQIKDNNDASSDFQQKILDMMTQHAQENENAASKAQQKGNTEQRNSSEKVSVETEAAFSIEYP